MNVVSDSVEAETQRSGIKLIANIASNPQTLGSQYAPLSDGKSKKHTAVYVCKREFGIMAVHKRKVLYRCLFP